MLAPSGCDQTSGCWRHHTGMSPSLWRPIAEGRRDGGTSDAWADSCKKPCQLPQAFVSLGGLHQNNASSLGKDAGKLQGTHLVIAPRRLSRARRSSLVLACLPKGQTRSRGKAVPPVHCSLNPALGRRWAGERLLGAEPNLPVAALGASGGDRLQASEARLWGAAQGYCLITAAFTMPMCMLLNNPSLDLRTMHIQQLPWRPRRRKSLLRL